MIDLKRLRQLTSVLSPFM